MLGNHLENIYVKNQGCLVKYQTVKSYKSNLSKHPPGPPAATPRAAASKSACHLQASASGVASFAVKPTGRGKVRDQTVTMDVRRWNWFSKDPKFVRWVKFHLRIGDKNQPTYRGETIYWS